MLLDPRSYIFRSDPTRKQINPNICVRFIDLEGLAQVKGNMGSVEK